MAHSFSSAVDSIGKGINQCHCTLHGSSIFPTKKTPFFISFHTSLSSPIVDTHYPVLVRLSPFNHEVPTDVTKF